MTDPSRPVRVAIIGAGSIAEAAHLPALQAQGGQARVVAVVDVDSERARAFAERWRIPAAFDEVQRMLAEAAPDLAIVCTPPSAHSEAVVACLDAGVWVWCEKPPALSLAEYDAIAAHERDGGPLRRLRLPAPFRLGGPCPARAHPHRPLGSPLIGICHTLWYRDDAYYEVPWRGRWSTEGGGPTMGHGIHQMDLMLTLLGEWTEVRAASGDPGPSGRDRGRVDGDRPLRLGGHGVDGQQRPVASGDQLPAGGLPRGDRRADPPLRVRQRELELDARAAPRRGHPGRPRRAGGQRRVQPRRAAGPPPRRPAPRTASGGQR